MKRNLAITLLLVLSVVLVGCSEKTNSPVTNDEQKNSNSFLYLTQESNENLISVEIPVIATENSKAVNACIKEQVYHELEHWLLLEECNLTESKMPIANISERMASSEYSAQYLHVSSHISLENEELVSIVFAGQHNAKSAAHPNDVFFTINVDILSAERVGVADLYTVDDALYDAFLRYANSERIDSDKLVSLDLFEKDTFLEGLTQEPEKEFYSYFTPTHTGISYPVIHALGDHIEAEIPNEWMRKAD